MSKYTQKRIDEIRSMTTIDIPNAIKNGISIDEYLNKYRLTLNLTIIQAVFGCEFDKPKKKDKYKVKFNHKLPKNDELATITKLLNNFVETVENPFFAIEYANGTTGNNSDDMNIPGEIEIAYNELPELGKVNTKKIHDYIFGSEAICKMYLTGMDVIELAAVAEKIKKVKTRNTMLIIGGIALVLTGGAIATAAVVNSKKDKNNDVDINDPDTDIELIDLDSIDVEDIIDDDSPKVEFAE